MPSKLDIVNHALILLGESPLSDFTSNTGEVVETVCRRMRQEMLMEHRWRFAVKKAALTEASGSPVNEWENHFDFPSDMLLLIRTYPSSNYEVFADKLLTNNESVSIDYIYDPGIKAYPEYFANALAHRIAAEVCMAITNNHTLYDSMKQKYLMVLGAAKFKDSQGRPPKAIQSRPWIDIRR